MSDERKFVWLIRHGKSAWPSGVPDMERPLNQRGRRDGATMAKVLHSSDHAPQVLYSSDSERTRQTTELLNEVLRVSVIHTHDLYTAIYPAVEKLLKQVDESFSSVGVVSHLPTIESCIRATGEWPEERAFPTLAAVCYKLSGKWRTIDFATAKYQKFFMPRMFRADAP